jgi:integrase
VRWATARGLMPKLQFPAGQRTGPTAAVIDDDPAELARRLLHDRDLPVRDRVAALLVVLFAQPVSRIARLTIHDVTIDQDGVAIRLGATAIALPEPLATHLRDLVANRRSRAAAAIHEPRWLFHGKAPGRPIGELALSRRLKQIGVDCAAQRRTALMQLAGHVPAALLADLLGVHIATAIKWAEIAGRRWGDYPTLRDP